MADIVVISCPVSLEYLKEAYKLLEAVLPAVTDHFVNFEAPSSQIGDDENHLVENGVEA